jgi:ABC-2 type transport system ATP-binding protein
MPTPTNTPTNTATSADVDPPLDCIDVTRSFGGYRAVQGITLRVAAGEVLALIGLNGAGKTTLMRLLLGMLRPDSGRVRVLGHEAATAPPTAWERVGQMIETPFAYPELTVRENLWTAARLHGMDRADVRQAVSSVIDRLDLTTWADRRCSTLSLGNRQRVGLASAVVHRPGLLVLDEPTNALDPAGVVLLRELVQDLAGSGTAVLVSSHHLDEVSRVADRVMVIHRGRLIGELDPHGADLERTFFAMAYDADAQAGLAPEGLATKSPLAKGTAA